MYASGVWPAKIGLLFGRWTHSFARLRPWRMCSDLKMPIEIRDARQAIAVEDPVGIPLHFVKRAVGDAAEQRSSVLIAHFPARHDVEKRLQARRRQALAHSARAEIGGHVGAIAGGGIPERRPKFDS